ncbi:hypothetical protein AB346_00420 [Listeria innocua]|uniref:hypothetical protein n=1 Tax=Listeria innocua TaxID=1642 RepID=UPI001A99997D|nr:hypothetical protein [Listeria innocua]EAF5657757.1 hypothetical protein [Listeria innocua]UPH62888.1 hypothetical protein AB346_00420 [Listeria innocua]
MKGLIINKMHSDYFTNMSEVFNLLPEEELNCMWLVSSYDCNIYPSEQIPFDKDYVWMRGTKLKEILNQKEIMFIWGNFTSYPSDTELKDVLKYPIPFADGNKDLWEEDVQLSNPLANTELISWDSSIFLALSKNTSIIELLKANYPDSEDLSKYNSDID